MITVLPSVAVLEMTYCCNHACRFCSCPWFAGMLEPGTEMSIDEWKRLIEAYSCAGVSQFSFTGGEALLKEGCLELMDFAAKCLGGCREAARVFAGSPIAPDPLFHEGVFVRQQGRSRALVTSE